MKERFNSMVAVLFKILLGHELDEDDKVALKREKYAGQLLGRCLDGALLEKKLSSYDNFDSGKAYSNFLRRSRGPLRSHPYSFIAGIAAACMLFAVGGFWLWESRQPADAGLPSVASVACPAQIMPGSYKAILTLTDGEVVNIHHDSTLTDHSNGAKVNYSGGSISYKGTDSISELAFNTLEVPLTAECKIVLEDGSLVWINSGSRLKYPVRFMGKERKVFLEGEAYFQVKKGSMPFVVSTVFGDVRVLGTSFNVKAYAEEERMAATLESGKVRFQQRQHVQDLLPGEQLLAGRDGTLEKRMVDTDEYTGWRTGKYVFKNRRLEDIMVELSRWYGMKVIYLQPGLKNLEFTGNLVRYDTVNAFLDLLERTDCIHYRISGDTVILYR